VIGAAVAATLLYAVVRGPVEARVDDHHIVYQVDLWGGGLLVALYVVATCGSLLQSSERHVRWFGAANLAAVGALAWIDRAGLISLWCFWAALISVAIAAHLRYSDDPPLVRATATVV
jgi:hypothetical protein